MIAKTSDSNRPTDPRNQAGLAAERKMAFYLRRAFEHERDVWVFNDLRLVKNGDAAQMDHLVLHRSGMVIIESKSVTGEIAVNERGEWTRRSGGRQQGLECPVTQARLQAQFLRRLLRENDERLLDGQLKGLLPKHFNKHWPIDIVVAVSDGGRISRGMDVPELLKADQVAETTQAIVKKHKRGRFSPNPLNSDAMFVLSAVEMGRLVQFLGASHTPARSNGPKTATARPTPALTDPDQSCDQAIFEKLRLLRKRLADERGIPAYMVFPDETLKLIAAKRPRNERELLRLRGVGEKKLRQYGGPFLRTLMQENVD